MHSCEVHSNESACRKKVRLGLEQVIMCIKLLPEIPFHASWFVAGVS